MLNHYRNLGLERGASPNDIRKAYYKLALQYHPDKAPDKRDLFERVAKAYEILNDPASKACYDQELTQYIETHGDEPETYIYIQMERSDLFATPSFSVDAAPAIPIGNEVTARNEVVSNRNVQIVHEDCEQSKQRSRSFIGDGYSSQELVLSNSINELNLTATMAAIQYPKEHIIQIAKQHLPLGREFLANTIMRDYLGEEYFYELLLTIYYFSKAVERTHLAGYFAKIITTKQQHDFMAACINRDVETEHLIKNDINFFKKFDVNNLYLLARSFSSLIPVFFETALPLSSNNPIIGFLKENPKALSLLKAYLDLDKDAYPQFQALLSVLNWLSSGRQEDTNFQKVEITFLCYQASKIIPLPDLTQTMMRIPNNILDDIHEMGRDLFLQSLKLSLFPQAFSSIFWHFSVKSVKNVVYQDIKQLLLLLKANRRFVIYNNRNQSSRQASPLAVVEQQLKAFLLSKMDDLFTQEFKAQTTVAQILNYIAQIIVNNQELGDEFLKKTLSYLFTPFKISSNHIEGTSVLEYAVAESSSNPKIVQPLQNIADFLREQSDILSELVDKIPISDKRTRQLSDFLFTTKSQADSLSEAKAKIEELFLQARNLNVPLVLIAQDIRVGLETRIDEPLMDDSHQHLAIYALFETIQANLEKFSQGALFLNNFIFPDKTYVSQACCKLLKLIILLMQNDSLNQQIIRAGFIQRLKPLLDPALPSIIKKMNSLDLAQSNTVHDKASEFFKSPLTTLLQVDDVDIHRHLTRLVELPVVTTYLSDLQSANNMLLSLSERDEIDEAEVRALTHHINTTHCAVDFFTLLPPALIEQHPTLIWRTADLLLSSQERRPHHLKIAIENIRSAAELNPECQPHFFFLDDAIIFIEKNNKTIDGKMVKKFQNKFGEKIEATLAKYDLDIRVNLTTRITAATSEEVKYTVTTQANNVDVSYVIWQKLKTFSTQDNQNIDYELRRLREELELYSHSALGSSTASIMALKSSYDSSPKIWLINAALKEFNDAYPFVVRQLESSGSPFWSLILSKKYEALLEKLAADLGLNYWPINHATVVELSLKTKQTLMEKYKRPVDAEISLDMLAKLKLLSASQKDTRFFNWPFVNQAHVNSSTIGNKRKLAKDAFRTLLGIAIATPVLGTPLLFKRYRKKTKTHLDKAVAATSSSKTKGIKL